jgi:hypothetical protein
MQNKNKQYAAIGSIAVGLLSVFASTIPIAGAALAIFGFLLGKGSLATHRIASIVGVSLSVLGLAASMLMVLVYLGYIFGWLGA